MGRQPLNTVSLSGAQHLFIVFQMYGSAWPVVLPYCIVNVAIAATIMALSTFFDIDLTISGDSHSFMNLLVAFLLVSRVSLSVSRYNDARSYIGAMYKETREIVQKVIGLTRRMQEPGDREWRNETAYRTLLLLRTSMAVIDYESEKIPAWEVPELDPTEAAEIKRKLSYDFGPHTNSDGCLSQRTINAQDDSFRVPLFMGYRLRQCLDSARDRLSENVEELRCLNIYAHVDSFINSYYSIWKFITTPFPFPLVQMTRTFLLFYIFTVPFALLSDVSSQVAHLFVIFFLTYGFIGLEAIAIELDDPFGDDPNDFDNIAMAQAAFNDVYLLIMSIDGEEYMNKLRARMQRPPTKKAPGESSWLLGDA